MDSPKISIVMPMFNSEKFIRMCVESILNQTFKDFELIIVDDKSSDSSLEQIPNDSRLKIIKNEENLGVAKSRNIGLKSAAGKYIYFVDADDAIFPQTLETLFNVAEESGSDIVHMNSCFETSDDAQSLDSEISAEQIYDANANPRTLSFDLQERIGHELLHESMLPVPWLNLYRRDFLIDNEILFPEIQCCSELLHHYTSLILAQKFMVIDAACYLHRLHPDAISSSSPDQKLRIFISSLSNITEAIQKIFSRKLPIQFAPEAVNTLEIHMLNRATHSQIAESFSMPFELIDQIEREEFDKLSRENLRFMQILFNANIANLFRTISLQNQQQVVTFE